MKKQNEFTCVIIDDEDSARKLLSIMVNEIYPHAEILGTYDYWKDALKGITVSEPDILFVDVSMPGMTGIQFLKLLPDIRSEVIFVTAHAEYALDVFDFNVSGYLLKPITYQGLSKSINRALGRILIRESKDIKNQDTVSKIGITDVHGITYVNKDDIVYIQSINKCVEVVMKGNKITSSFSLKSFREVLNNIPFVQIHRSFIININHMYRYDKSGLVTMCNKIEIPISKSYKNDFLGIMDKLHK